MRKYAKLGVSAAGLAALVSADAPGHAQSRPSGIPIQWIVKDRFRLFDQADGLARKRVEELMHQISQASADAPLKDHYEVLLHTLAYGDAASLRSSNYQQVKAPTIGSGQYKRTYLYPDFYTIRVSLGPSAPAGAVCLWRSAIERIGAACAGEAEIRVAAARTDPAGEWQADTALRVSIGGSPEVLTEPIRLRDRLIVALGDSYISGEGNPDVPSVVTDRPLATFEHASWGQKLRENRGEYRRAEWWDEPCHRSLLSWPVLASLAYSARHPQEAVTLVHLGCSGATVKDIIEKGEVELPGGGDELPGETQLAKLERLLNAAPPRTARRVPDRILLSIGGNDSGFVGVIKTLFLPPNGYWIPGLGPAAVGGVGGAVCPYRRTGWPLSVLCIAGKSAEERMEEGNQDGLRARYGLLQNKLALTVSGEAGEASSREARDKLRPLVYQMAYPNPILDENLKPCTLTTTRDPKAVKEMSGLEALMGIIPRPIRGFTYSWNFQLLHIQETVERDPIPPSNDCDWNPDPDDNEVCQALWVHGMLNRAVAQQKDKWEVVEGHVQAISGHGLCRKDDDFPLALPRVVGGRWMDGWTPQSFHPYHQSNERWFRTPNDSIVTQYGGPDRFYHGTVHPTYRAHIEFAQAALDTAFKSLEAVAPR